MVAYLLAFAFGVVTTILPAIINGWVVSVLWGWFVAPLFKISALSLPFAVGIVLLFGLLIQHDSEIKTDVKKGSELVEMLVAKIILYPFIILVAGWVAHTFT